MGKKLEEVGICLASMTVGVIFCIWLEFKLRFPRKAVL